MPDTQVDPLHQDAHAAGPGNRTIDAGAGNSDSADLAMVCRQLWNTTAAALTVAVVAAGDADATARTVVIPAGSTDSGAGIFDRFYVRRIKATGTDAAAKVAGAVIGIN